jgi:pimeloyl-ACP methyl ester carboxylesterase
MPWTGAVAAGVATARPMTSGAKLRTWLPLSTRSKRRSTSPREARTELGYTFVPERFRDLHTPTLLLVGGDSQPRELRNATGIAAVLPNARVIVLAGQQHAAMYAAPRLFVREVVQFTAAVQP